MWRIKRQRGFTLIEVVVALAITGMIVPLIVIGIFQSTRITAEVTPQVAAMQDISFAAPPLMADIHMAQKAEVELDLSGYPTILILDWYIYKTGDLADPDSYTKVYSRCKYTLEEHRLMRELWENGTMDEELQQIVYTEASSISYYCHYLTNVNFFIPPDTADDKERYIEVTITSSPENRPETLEELTYKFWMRNLEDI